MNNHFETTMANCREYIRSHFNTKFGFENMESSNCTGFEYTLKSGTSIKLRVDNSIKFLIFEVFPGITVRGAHQPMIAEYCQKMTEFPCTGYFALDPDHGNIYYHCETSFRDQPVSISLLKKMESLALNTLKKHIPVLECLAYGKLPTWNCLAAANDSHQDTTFWLCSAQEQELLDCNIDALRGHITNSGHNVVAETLNSANIVPYFLETICDDTRYRDYMYIKDGFLIRALKLDIKCADAYRTQAAQFCNKSSDEKKVGFLKIAEDGYPYCIISTYLIDGPNPISEETLTEMERIAITFLHLSAPKLAYICNGVIPPENIEEDSLDPKHEIARDMVHQMLRGSRSEEGNNSHSLFDLFASMDAHEANDLEEIAPSMDVFLSTLCGDSDDEE